jgi:hypothetical protein
VVHEDEYNEALCHALAVAFLMFSLQVIQSAMWVMWYLKGRYTIPAATQLLDTSDMVVNQPQIRVYNTSGCQLLMAPVSPHHKPLALSLKHWPPLGEATLTLHCSPA